MGDKINLELLLRDLYESMSELSVVLDREHAALSNDDVELLQEAAVKKEILSDRVEQLDSQRKSFLDSKGLNNDLAGMQALVQQSSGQDENALYKLWNMVAQLSQDCAAKNRLSGIVIEAKRRQTNAALSLLQGYQSDGSELYDAEGASVQMNSNNTIAKA